MSTFDKREDAFERRFAVDEEINFKARARRNRRVGAWAAQLLGKEGAAAEAYAGDLVAAQAAGQGDDELAAALRRDFDRAKVEMSDHRIRRKLEEALAEARAEFLKGT